MLKSSADKLGENNARCLLKSVQNNETLFNNISINMLDYFINTFFSEGKSYFKKMLKISTQNFE